MKREVNLRCLIPLALTLIALSFSWHVGYVQSSTIDTGILVYRRMAGKEEQLVGLTPLTQHVFSAYDPQCLAISQTGIFIVTSTHKGTDLIVRRFSTGEVIRQFNPQSTWATCTLRWHRKKPSSVRARIWNQRRDGRRGPSQAKRTCVWCGA